MEAGALSCDDVGRYENTERLEKVPGTLQYANENTTRGEKMRRIVFVQKEYFETNEKKSKLPPVTEES